MLKREIIPNSSIGWVEQRIAPHRRVLKTLPGKLILKETGEEITFKPIDASYAGIGIFSEFEIETKDNILLMLGDQQIELEIVYAVESPGREIGYRYGLKVVDPDINLEEILFHGIEE